MSETEKPFINMSYFNYGLGFKDFFSAFTHISNGHHVLDFFLPESGSLISQKTAKK